MQPPLAGLKGRTTKDAPSLACVQRLPRAEEELVDLFDCLLKSVRQVKSIREGCLGRHSWAGEGQ